jgi:hypothetical protein
LKVTTLVVKATAAAARVLGVNGAELCQDIEQGIFGSSIGSSSVAYQVAWREAGLVTSRAL